MEKAANLKCFLHEGQLFFETLERIPVHTDLIVAQANHGCDNGLPMIEAIAALMFGKLDYYFSLKNLITLTHEIYIYLSLVLFLNASVHVERFFTVYNITILTLKSRFAYFYSRFAHFKRMTTNQLFSSKKAV